MKNGVSETSVLTRATRRNNPEDTILHLRTWYRFVVNCPFWSLYSIKGVVINHSMRGLVDLKAGLEMVVKRKVSDPVITSLVLWAIVWSLSWLEPCQLVRMM
jgi:hypothetical protein